MKSISSNWQPAINKGIQELFSAASTKATPHDETRDLALGQPSQAQTTEQVPDEAPKAEPVISPDGEESACAMTSLKTPSADEHLPVVEPQDSPLETTRTQSGAYDSVNKKRSHPYGDLSPKKLFQSESGKRICTEDIRDIPAEEKADKDNKSGFEVNSAGSLYIKGLYSAQEDISNPGAEERSVKKAVSAPFLYPQRYHQSHRISFFL